MNIARNILSGNGFAYTYSDYPFETVPVVGGYMPGYPMLLAMCLYLGLGSHQIAFAIDCARICAAVYACKAIFQATNKPLLSILALVLLCFSPWGLGFSRLLLIEPVLAVLSLLFIGLSIRILFGIGGIRLNIWSLFFNLLAGITLKPTYAIFIVPAVLCICFQLGLKARFVKYILTGSMVIALGIIPWGYRNLRSGAVYMFPSHSNIFPEYVQGFGVWVNTFALTQYDYTKLVYPSWSGRVWGGNTEITDISIQDNTFLSAADANEAQLVLASLTNGTFTKNADIFFTSQAAKRLHGVKGKIRFLFVKLLQSLSIFFHPASSWGLPIEINSLPASQQQTCLSRWNISCWKFYDFAFKKTMAFLWRSLIELSAISLIGRYLSCFAIYFSPFSVRRLDALKKLVFSLSVLTLASTICLIVLIVFIMGFLEQHYFYPLIGWIEILAALHWYLFIRSHTSFEPGSRYSFK